MRGIAGSRSLILSIGLMSTELQGSSPPIEYVVMSPCQNGMDLEVIGLILDCQCMWQLIESQSMAVRFKMFAAEEAR